MSTVNRLRERGFAVRLRPDGAIGVTPQEQLPAEWRQWIIQHRDELIAELAAEASNDTQHDPRQAPRWQAFVRLCERRGALANEVDADFTDQDIGDLLTEPDDKLPRHAETLAASLILRRKPEDRQGPRSSQTCGGCQHFQKRDDHEFMGRCGAGVPQSAHWLWSADGRDYCTEFAPDNASDPVRTPTPAPEAVTGPHREIQGVAA